MPIKRPLLGAAIALMLGEVLAWWNPVVGILILAAIELMLLIRCKKEKVLLCLPLIGCAGLLLFSAASRPGALEGYLEQKERIPACIQGRVGRIQEKNNSYQIILTDVSVKIQKQSFSSHNLLLYFLEDPKLHIGNQIQACGKLQNFTKASNPGQFDVAAYYRAQKVDFGFAVEEFTLESSGRDWLADWLYQCKCRLAKIIRSASEEPDSGVFQAALLGDQSDMDEGLKALYQENGIAHILAISGLHISCIGMGCYQILKRSSGSYALAGIGGALIMLAYGIMTGSSVSAMRALIMFFCMILANYLGRIYDMASALSLAVLWLLLCYPLQLFQCGFQLSAGAVAGIGIVAPSLLGLYEGEKKWMRGIIVSCSVQIVTIPILLYHFFTYPVYSIFLNFLVLPFVSYLLLSAGIGALTGLFSMPLAVFWLGSGHYVLKYYSWLCGVFQKIPGAVQVWGRPAWWQLFIYAAALVCLVIRLERYREKKKWKEAEKKQTLPEAGLLGGLAVGLFIGFLCLKPILYPGLQITMLDVGQGDGNFLLFPDGTTMLIDGGSSSVKGVGEKRLTPYLKSLGIRKLDYILMTHPDGDHINGILELLQAGEIEAGQLLLPDGKKMKEEFSEFLKFSIPVTWMSAGMRLQCGETKLSCLHPSAAFQSEDSNAYSIVLLLSWKKFEMLFTGDLGAAEEQALTDLPEIEVLKAGHHGSKNSTSEEFLNQLKPQQALLSYGKGNSYGHPHKETLERLKQANVHLWKTPECGAITIKTDGLSYEIETYLLSP